MSETTDDRLVQLRTSWETWRDLVGELTNVDPCQRATPSTCCLGEGSAILSAMIRGSGLAITYRTRLVRCLCATRERI